MATMPKARPITKTVRPTRRLTNSQRTKVKLAKIQGKNNRTLGKTLGGEVGGTIRSLGASASATSIANTQAREQTKREANARMAEATQGINDAMSKYNAIIAGNPDSEGETGDSSTTEITTKNPSYGGW